jgi:hypothetical protein
VPPATNNTPGDEINVAIISTETKSGAHGNAPKIDRAQSEENRVLEERLGGRGIRSQTSNVADSPAHLGSGAGQVFGRIRQ